MSSLTCTFVFYRPELNAKRGGAMILNFEGLEMKYTNGYSSKSSWEKSNY